MMKNFHTAFNSSMIMDLNLGKYSCHPIKPNKDDWVNPDLKHEAHAARAPHVLNLDFVLKHKMATPSCVLQTLTGFGFYSYRLY